MRARLIEQVSGRRVGLVVVRDGVAEPDAGTAPYIDGLWVVVPGRPDEQVTPADGEVYIEALPATLRGPGIAAVVE